MPACHSVRDKMDALECPRTTYNKPLADSAFAPCKPTTIRLGPLMLAEICLDYVDATSR